MQVLIKVIDRNQFDNDMYTGVVYTHETMFTGSNAELEQIYNEFMTARFIITLAALHNHKSYDLFIHQIKPCITFNYDPQNMSVIITYYVKEL